MAKLKPRGGVEVKTSIKAGADAIRERIADAVRERVG
jgi:hypothetical protein